MDQGIILNQAGSDKEVIKGAQIIYNHQKQGYCSVYQWIINSYSKNIMVLTLIISVCGGE